MRLKHQLYILFSFIFCLLLIFSIIVYNSYIDKYNQDIDKYIQKEIDLHKKEIVSSLQNASNILMSKKNLFFKIHQDTINKLKNKNDIDLNSVKKEILSTYELSGINIELYLINKKYTIYDTTFAKDLGFNLSVIKEAKEFLDKTTIDNKIYMADFVSTDSLDMKYKLYSYSKLDENGYLELGFMDNSIFNASVAVITNNLAKNVSLYNIFIDNGYTYYDIKIRDNIKSKEEYYKSITKYNNKENINDNIINTIKYNKKIVVDSKNKKTIYTRLFDKNVYKKIGYDNVVMKIDIDISKDVEFLEYTKELFTIFMIVLVFIFAIIFIFVKYKLTTPIDTIIENISNAKKIDTLSVDNKNELAQIANEYNKLFDLLHKEIEKSHFLLQENKQFIADTVHQIRTPLSNIMLNSDMIKLYNSDSDILEYIEQINASINMLTNSYEDLAYITSFDTIEYTKTEINISNMLTYRIKFFNTIAKVNYKNLLSDIDKDLYFEINKIEFERLVDNNISNAIKYGNINTTIEINLKKIDNKAILSFASSGENIQNKEKIFDKNYRENHSKRGLGLGLNIVKNICAKYNILYDVTSKDNKNIFTYTFDLETK